MSLTGIIRTFNCFFLTNPMSAFLLFAGGVLTIFGLSSLWRSINLLRHGARAEGRVLGWEYHSRSEMGPIVTPRIAYRGHDGEEHIFRSRNYLLDSLLYGRRPANLPVRYLAGKHFRAEVASRLSLWLCPMMTILMGLGALLLASWVG